MNKKVKCICNEPVCGMKVCGYNSPLLKVGKIYTVTDVEVHPWHTLYKLQEFGDKQFNSVDFTSITDEENKSANDIPKKVRIFVELNSEDVVTVPEWVKTEEDLEKFVDDYANLNISIYYDALEE